MLCTMTVEVDVLDAEAARSLGVKAGFTVKRVAASPVKASAATPPTPGVRASALLDIPAGLDRLEHKAYVRGYAAACMTHAKKNGIPRGDDLTAATIAYEWDRHPAAHKKGLTELMRERSHPSRQRR